ncbi:hypothetical protein [Serratia proteamaculans]
MNEVLTYEALKADRDAQQKRADALAVENAAKNEILNWNLETGMSASARAFHVGCDAKGCLHDAVQAMLIHFHTPATDAALAAVKKQAHIDGIEQFIAEMLDRGNDPTNSITESTRADMRRAAMFARTFVELREAK